MPAEQGIWLHDEQSLFPGANQPSQQDEEQSIGFRTCRSFHLPLEDDERLSQEGIFRHQLGLAPAKVGQRLQRQGGSERLVHRVKRAESAYRQPSKSRRSGVTTPVIREASPSRKSIVVRARGCSRRRLILHRPCTGYLDHPFKNKHVETVKDLQGSTTNRGLKKGREVATVNKN